MCGCVRAQLCGRYVSSGLANVAASVYALSKCVYLLWPGYGQDWYDVAVGHRLSFTPGM